MGAIATVLATTACVFAAIVLGLALAGKAGLALAGLAMLFIVPVAFWVNLSLQARRIRDIGWDPIIIIPAWLAVAVANIAVAHWYPALSIHARGQTTLLGFGLSISFAAVLLLVPGAEPDEPADMERSSLPTRPVRPPPQAAPGGFGAAAPRQGFGRR